MAKIKNLVFDLGDVLFSYRWCEMLMDYGLPQEEAERVGREMFDDPRRLWHEYDLGTYTTDEVILEFAREWPQDEEVIAWFIRHGEYMTVPRPKVWEKVHQLKLKGYPVYLLSNYPKELFHKHTEYADFMKDLDGAVISYEHHEGKPDRAIYERLCETYHLDPAETLFFDDREENVRGALDYGMQAKRVLSQEGLLEDLDALLERSDAVAADKRNNGKQSDAQNKETDGNANTNAANGRRTDDPIQASDNNEFNRTEISGIKQNSGLKIAVYCGANEGDNPIYAEGARKLGQWIGRKGNTLVYGAGRVGMMGAVADNVQAYGGKIIGVIPQFMVDNGWHRGNLDEMIVTDSMSTRKAKMIELADVYIAMPGGPGTLDEIAEVISLSALQLHRKECFLCSIDGYYEPLQQMYERMIQQDFAGTEKLIHVHFPAGIDELLLALDKIGGYNE